MLGPILPGFDSTRCLRTGVVLRVTINSLNAEFFTELKHPMVRSSVRRISVPPQFAEVSS